MSWLRSRSTNVLPRSSDTNRAPRCDSMTAYTRAGFEGAMTTADRPHGLAGNPLAVEASRSCHEWPPSSVTRSPLPLGTSGESPPERKVQPLRRKSHSAANRRSGFCGSMAIDEQPVDRLPPLRTSCHDAPPSVVLYRPRSVESLQSSPGTHAYTTSPFVG